MKQFKSLIQAQSYIKLNGISCGGGKEEKKGKKKPEKKGKDCPSAAGKYDLTISQGDEGGDYIIAVQTEVRKEFSEYKKREASGDGDDDSFIK